ncbi:DUF421 domain-containing protein [Paraburkholderia kururiensis]|uniref:DUF421 domain-containing protein n=1 Tax=Paraburkholderia kururiensis TaxID=984307 RepID=A0ABZ0WRS7_9BURK|nr:DUF421 domain-containing protein [Paraburkholderia kururiensis]WQD80077.1 DUF421 domain-containing protein [Paraburkholderia kururiensis]
MRGTYRGMRSMDDVKYVVVETNGGISIVEQR